MDFKTKALMVGAAAVLVFLAARGAWSGLQKAVPAVLDAVNPVSSTNLAYRGTSAVTQAVTNDPYATFGTKLYEVFNPGAVAAERAALTGTPAYNALDAEDMGVGIAMRSSMNR